MKRIMVILAATAAILASCSKSEPESGRKNANEEITLNISVSNPSNSSKALIKSDWAVGDRILIWYDGNTQEKPDMAIKYDGSKWNNDTDVEVSGNAPAESGCLKALYDGAVKVTAKDGYTYSGGALTARLQTWTFLTEIQVVVTGISGSGNYSLSCDKFTPCTGYSVGSGGITASQGRRGSEVAGMENTDGVAFVFASADYSAGVFEFTVKNYSSGEVPKTYTMSRSLVQEPSEIKAARIAYGKFDIPYVIIDGVKWTKENIAITPSGKREFNHTGHVNGDYFQWAAYAGFCGNPTDADKGLLVYSSFRNRMCGDSNDDFTFKPGMQFNVANAPYGGTYYTKYTSGQAVLEKGDDVATIILGEKWHIPTKDQWQAMYDATAWTWDSADNGIYVTEKGTALNADKSNALLFLPAAGCGDATGMDRVGLGRYWASNLNENDITYARSLLFSDHQIEPQYQDWRHAGFTVHAVSK